MFFSKKSDLDKEIKSNLKTKRRRFAYKLGRDNEIEQKMKKHIEIRIQGIVQGVGFRPFVYATAQQYNIKGTVRNDTEGVLIRAESSEKNLNLFLNAVQTKYPGLAHISSLTYRELPIENYLSFTIEKSELTAAKSAFYSPDIAVCEACQLELFDKKDRRFGYPFITCIRCGPRFSIITDIPYDRHNTSMQKFTQCQECQSEYADPNSRRHHSQPNACPVCGPELKLLDNTGSVIETETEQITARTIDLLRAGQIVAVKGIGGYHLAVDANNAQAVGMLRQRKNRPFKPFAVMYGSIDGLVARFHLNPLEKQLLLSMERPIVLLKEKEPNADGLLAPGLTYQGIMLPYTPFQHMLFTSDANLLLVMTSANVADEPIIYKDSTALERLRHIADYFVVYDRDIVIQSDDSVVFVEEGRAFFVRRSRGYVPAPFWGQPVKKHILAMGGDLKNSFALARDDFSILSHYLGDMADPYTQQAFQESIAHFLRIFAFKPEVVVADMHPAYFTTKYADELPDVRKIEVQHHHAHIASVLEDQGIDGPVIGIAFDGTGYGTDGTLWGSEFFLADRKSFQRVGHFSYFPLPGGESAIKDVWKIGTALIYQACGRDSTLLEKTAAVLNVLEIIDKNINCPVTCSIGRIFDGVAAMLGVAQTVSAEAEAAILLEEAANMSNKQPTSIKINIDTVDDMLIIRTQDLIKQLAALIQSGCPRADMAYAMHSAIVEVTVTVVAMIKERYSIDTVVLSGGVFQNRLLLRLLLQKLPTIGIQVYTPQNVPFNDGCIAVGQIAVAREMMKV